MEAEHWGVSEPFGTLAVIRLEPGGLTAILGGWPRFCVGPVGVLLDPGWSLISLSPREFPFGTQASFPNLSVCIACFLS